MSRSLSLTRWFQQSVATGNSAPRRALVALTVLHVLRDAALIAAYWGFAAMVSQWIIDGVAVSSSLLWFTAICLAGVWLSQGCSIWLNHHGRLKLLSRLQQQLLRTFGRQQHALVRQHSTFHWQTLWQMHIPAVVNWHFDYRVQQLVAVLVPLFALVVIFSVSIVVGGSLLITLPIVPLFMILVGKGAAALHRKHFIALERLGRLFTDRISALPLLAMFNAHDAQARRLDTAGQHLRERTMKVVSVAFLSGTVLDFFSTLAVALIAVYIGFTLLGEFNLGETIDLQQGLWLLLTAPLLLSEMKKLGQFYHQKAQAESAMEAIQDLLHDSPPDEVPATRDEVAPIILTGELTRSPALSTSTLTVNPGDWIRLNGASGAGKTVLMELLSGQRPGLAKPVSDYVLLTQTPVILPGTVRENLCLAMICSDTQLLAVLDSVELGAWLSMLPAGLDTPMGEHPPLSGGQAQRLAIARLLLRQAPVWFLDEPTAHLPQSQHEAICQIIHRNCQHATVIWASHKPLPSDWFNAHWLIKDGRVCDTESAELSGTEGKTTGAGE